MPVRPAEARTLVRGSRFVVWLGPAGDVASARSALDIRTAAGHDATHHCWAYRIWSGGTVEEGAFDAGEPGGTAGRPILGALQRAGVVQAVCVVSRWFGGTRLGTGGLVRAYAEAAQAAIAAGRKDGAVRDAVPRVTLRVEFDYSQAGSVQRVIARFGARSTATSYGDRAALEISVPASAGEAFQRALVDATAGSIALGRGELRLEAPDA